MDDDSLNGKEPLDLELEKVIDAPLPLVWKAWSDPELIKQWWAPLPYRTIECVMEMRPGGRFRTVMLSPEGEQMPGDGVFLEVIEMERIVFTDALLPGYRPSAQPFFTAIITLRNDGDKTVYKARVKHKDAEDCRKHAEMGFHAGWGQVIDQLGTVARELNH